ncbi:toxin-antitoxin system YwqK family antitoxin [Fluviicola chungangensis]|nr:toxin-antitoxin system YwqK family antitoxin [Fluviicola chungangensis]
MKLKLTLLFAVGFTLNSLSQNLTFVMDSIMNVYMKNGYANEHFRPKGKEDSKGNRQGNWKDYEVSEDFMYLTENDIPIRLVGLYLLYGEGKFVDSLREGPWKFYVLEDKTFRKILQKEVTYTKGKKTGAYTYFFPNGKVSMTGSFDENKMTEVKVYYEDGKLFRSTFVLAGKRTGKSTNFYPDGKPMLECTYMNDTLNGSFHSYYPNEKDEEVSFFKMGQPDGTYKYYHENGQLWIEKEYSNGLLLNVKCNYDESGKLRDPGTLKDGNGTIYYYTRTGYVYNVQTYKNGVMISEAAKSEFDR